MIRNVLELNCIPLKSTCRLGFMLPKMISSHIDKYNLFRGLLDDYLPLCPLSMHPLSLFHYSKCVCTSDCLHGLASFLLPLSSWNVPTLSCFQSRHAIIRWLVIRSFSLNVCTSSKGKEKMFAFLKIFPVCFLKHFILFQGCNRKTGIPMSR